MTGTQFNAMQLEAPQKSRTQHKSQSIHPCNNNSPALKREHIYLGNCLLLCYMMVSMQMLCNAASRRHQHCLAKTQVSIKAFCTIRQSCPVHCQN